MNYALLIYESAAGFALRTDPQKQEASPAQSADVLNPGSILP
jgi:hypothetical protein